MTSTVPVTLRKGITGTPDGRYVYVTSGPLVRIDTADRSTTKLASGSVEANGLALVAGQRRMYVVNPLQDTVSAVDLA